MFKEFCFSNCDTIDPAGPVEQKWSIDSTVFPKRSAWLNDILLF
jgi:hypothetical protein